MAILKKKIRTGSESDTIEALRGLALRLSLNAGTPPRVVAFIAARSGEGTSSLAYKYARLLTSEAGKKVLLIDASLTPSNRYEDDNIHATSTGIIDAALHNLPLESVMHEITPGLFAVRWVSTGESRAVADRISQNPEFWKRLQTGFYNIVIDSPSLQSSFEGVVLAAKADAAVLVVEAEATPAPVVQKLRDILSDAGAKIAGLVLTKRRFYIPQKVYKKL